MSLFDHLVQEAIGNQIDVASLQIVVEKELLHHDILREMSKAGLLKKLTFIGGTCLRSCFGSSRLSEDLDFTGGVDFTRSMLAPLSKVLIKQLRTKYDLVVDVSEPIKEKGNVDTWKLKVVTRPQQPSLPMQRIHIDICAIPSYDRKPMMLRNHYGVEMGTSGLILQVQSREEILADKMIAFALRPNRIKNRDLWDIGWLKQQNIVLPLPLIEKKIHDHRQSAGRYVQLLSERVQLMMDSPQVQEDFIHEMRRFLPPKIAATTVEKDEFWLYLTNLIKDEAVLVTEHCDGGVRDSLFEM